MYLQKRARNVAKIQDIVETAIWISSKWKQLRHNLKTASYGQTWHESFHFGSRCVF